MNNRIIRLYLDILSVVIVPILAIYFLWTFMEFADTPVKGYYYVPTAPTYILTSFLILFTATVAIFMMYKIILEKTNKEKYISDTRTLLNLIKVIGLASTILIVVYITNLLLLVPYIIILIGSYFWIMCILRKDKGSNCVDKGENRHVWPIGLIIKKGIYYGVFFLCVMFIFAQAYVDLPHLEIIHKMHGNEKSSCDINAQFPGLRISSPNNTNNILCEEAPLMKSFYYSSMNFFGAGLGDVTPAGAPFKFLTMIEVFIGLSSLALFIAIIGRDLTENNKITTENIIIIKNKKRK